MMRLTTIFHKSCIFVKKEEKIRDFLTWETCVRLDDIIETAWTKESCRFKSDWFSFKQKMMSHLLYLSLTLSYPTITLSFRLSVSVSLSSDVSLWLVSLPKFPYFSSCLRLSLCTLIHLALSPIPLFLYHSVYFHMEREVNYRACSYFKSIWFSPFTSKQCLKSILPKSLIQRQYLFMNIFHGLGKLRWTGIGSMMLTYTIGELQLDWENFSCGLIVRSYYFQKNQLKVFFRRMQIWHLIKFLQNFVPMPPKKGFLCFKPDDEVRPWASNLKLLAYVKH